MLRLARNGLGITGVMRTGLDADFWTVCEDQIRGKRVSGQVDVTALHGCNYRLPPGAFSEWPTIQASTSSQG